MKTRTNPVLAALSIGLLALATPAFAGHHESGEQGGEMGAGKGARPEPTAEQRAKMAEAHDKMAACLRSSRPMKECRAEMHSLHEKAHEGMHGMGACGDHGHHSGQEKGHEHGKGAAAGKAPSNTPANPQTSTPADAAKAKDKSTSAQP